MLAFDDFVLHLVKFSSGNIDTLPDLVESEFADPFVDVVVSECADALSDVLTSENVDLPLDVVLASVRMALVVDGTAASCCGVATEVFLRFVLGSPSLVPLPFELTSIAPIDGLLESSEPVSDDL